MTVKLSGKDAKWQCGYPCRCGEELYVYPILGGKRVMYNYLCEKCNNHGAWPPFNVWTKAYKKNG